MDFILKQTLENMSLFKIAVLLWNHQDIRVLVEEFTRSKSFSQLNNYRNFPPVFSRRRQKWQKIENQVTSKMAKLKLPIIVQQKMLVYIESVGLEIMKWMDYHLKYCCLHLNLPNEICWTPQATIDKKKTAESLVCDDSIDITTRYKLACIYCLEDDVFELFYKLSESEKRMFYSEGDPGEILQTELVVFWGYYVNGEVAKMGDMIRRNPNYTCCFRYLYRRAAESGNKCCYTYLFRSAAESGNKAATEYFLHKLNPDEKILVMTASRVISKCRAFFSVITDPPREYYTEVLCFLLSEMSKEQQIKVFRTQPAKVLCCFLDWPWQSFFPEIASQLWNFLPLFYYQLVFECILYKLCVGYKDYNYKKTFRDIWQQISDNEKRFVINNDEYARLLLMLLGVEDEENFKLIFQDITLIDKYTLIFSFGGLYLCKYMIDYDKWDLFKYFVHLLISSKDEMIKFKKKFKKFVQTDAKLRIDKYEKLFPLLDDFVREYDKRKNEDEAVPNSAKRLCNTEFKDIAHGSKE